MGIINAVHGTNVTDFTLYKLREGISRFLITDINNPAASAKAESDIVVMFDHWTPAAGYMDPNFAGALIVLGETEH